MLSYCLKCSKNTQSKNPEVVKTKKWKNNYLNVQCAILKNQNFLKNKKLEDC